MSTNYTTYQQHEPLRAPSNWSAQEKRFVAQLEELFDDIYRRYNRLRLEDMSSEFRKTFKGILDDGTEMKTAIEANAAGLTAEITRASLAEGTLQTNISATAEGLTAEITRATTAEGALSTSISATADGLSAEITRASTVEGNLSTIITATASNLSAEVTRATTAEGNLSSSISANANSITALVSKTGINSLGSSETLYSKITQNTTSFQTTFQRIGASGYTATGITTITENGITVTHSNLSNCYTQMSADGFRMFNSSNTVIGGLMSINNQICTAVNTFYNASYPGFKMDIGQFSPIDADATSAVGMDLKYNNSTFLHIVKNIYPSDDYAQYNEIVSENGLEVRAKTRNLVLSASNGSAISIGGSNSSITLLGRYNGRSVTITFNELYELLHG